MTQRDCRGARRPEPARYLGRSLSDCFRVESPVDYACTHQRTGGAYSEGEGHATPSSQWESVAVFNQEQEVGTDTPSTQPREQRAREPRLFNRGQRDFIPERSGCGKAPHARRRWESDRAFRENPEAGAEDSLRG